MIINEYKIIIRWFCKIFLSEIVSARVTSQLWNYLWFPKLLENFINLFIQLEDFFWK